MDLSQRNSKTFLFWNLHKLVDKEFVEPNHENLVNENEMLELLIGLTSGGSIENQGDGRSIRVETRDNMGRRSNKFQSMFNEISEELYS